MGLDGRLRRLDDLPLGTFAEVEAVLQAAFDGAQFGLTPSGSDKIRIAAKRGVEFPEAIRKAMETMPAMMQGVYEGEGFSVEFSLGDSEPVSSIDLTLRGKTTNSDSVFNQLATETGWVLEFPGLDEALDGK